MKYIVHTLGILLVLIVTGFSQVPQSQPAPTGTRPRPAQRNLLRNPPGSYVQPVPQPYYPRVFVSISDIRIYNGVKYNTKQSVLWENSFGQFFASGFNVLHHSNPHSNGMVYTFTTFVSTGTHIDITQTSDTTYEWRAYDGAKQILASRQYIEFATTNNINNETRLMRIKDIEYNGKLISAWTMGLPYTEENKKTLIKK